MKWSKILAIARKDLLEVQQNRAAWMPMIIVPLLFVVILPLAFILVPTMADLPLESLAEDPDLAAFLERMPAEFARGLQGLEPVQMGIQLMLGYLFAPMLLIFPLMFSTIIAAESFAGERERKTIEALLYTSASDRELFLGKVLAGVVPAVAMTWLSFLAYTLVLNGAGWSVFGRVWFPLPGWFPLIFWITPAVSLLGVSFTVLISARVATFMGAYQLGGSLVLLVVGLFIGQISGVVYLNVANGMLIGAGVWAAAVLLTWRAVRGFQRRLLLSFAA